MEFRHSAISISLLFSLALVGESHDAHELLAGEDYWQAVWPNTPIHSALSVLWKPGPTNVKGVDREGYTFEELCVKKSPSKGEHKYCAKSLGTLIGFAISKLGKNIQVLSGSFVHKQDQYTVEGVQNLGNRAVTCHRLNFQKVVFYCHEINETTAFMIQLVAGNGRKTQALAVCHADTSGMNHEMLHQAMKFDPDNNNPVCHFLGNKAVMWVPNFVLDDAYQSNMAS